MYNNSARYYDLIYSWKDYKKEASKIKSLIKKYKKSKGIDLLEIGCGTGGHAKYLKQDFNLLATDLNKKMLHFAQKNLPTVKFKQADMLHLNLGKRFDVVICLFSSIGYLKNYSNLNKAIKNFSNHLKPGGLLIIEPWFTKENYISGLPTMTTYKSKNIKIARMCVSKKKGIISIMDMYYLIAEKNKKLKQFVESHELALFDKSKIIEIMKHYGLKAFFQKKGLMDERGLYIGIKNGES